jgi:hypothetical protein
LSANHVCAFLKDQQTLHACTPSWPQCCSWNICKQNLFCGYASYFPYVQVYIFVFFTNNMLKRKCKFKANFKENFLAS